MKVGGALDWYSPICIWAGGELLDALNVAIDPVILNCGLASEAIKPASVRASNK
jgi:hypothetical protein